VSLYYLSIIIVIGAGFSFFTGSVYRNVVPFLALPILPISSLHAASMIRFTVARPTPVSRYFGPGISPDALFTVIHGKKYAANQEIGIPLRNLV
jgi:hypothetical protein